MLTRTKNDYAHKLLAHIEKVEKHDEQEVEVSVGDDGQLVFWLTEPTSVFGLFGRETQASVIRVAVDEPERFVVHLRNAGISVVWGAEAGSFCGGVVQGTEGRMNGWTAW